MRVGFLAFAVPCVFAGENCARSGGTCETSSPQGENVLFQRTIQATKIQSRANLTKTSGFVDALQDCRFAVGFPWTEEDALIQDSGVQDEYVKAALKWDGNYVAEGTGMTGCGLTKDHVVLMEDGSTDRTAQYTAASKESLHLSMLALSLVGTELGYSGLAHHWVAGTSTQEEADAEALSRLDAIIGAYERYNAECPACGGFIPWITVGDEGFITEGNKFKLPALDNGQLAWAMVAVVEALDIAAGRGVAYDADGGIQGLKDRFQAQVNRMKEYAALIFLHPKFGKCFARAKVKDNKLTSTQKKKSDYKGQKGKLADPFEGELMLMWLDLVADGITDQKRKGLWTKVMKANSKVSYVPAHGEEAGGGPIDVQEGWRFSAHEEWKYLVLPYGDDANCLSLRQNNERARTWHAHDNEIPGLMAACYDSSDLYIDRLGVEELSFGYDEPPESQLMVTPYGAFPLITVDRGLGLAWHRAMLARPKMQCQMGSVESSAFGSNEPSVAMKMSWDTKVTTDVAMAGTTGPLIKRYLQRESMEGTQEFAGTKYDRFLTIVGEQHAQYAQIRGTEYGYAPPPGPEQNDDLEAEVLDFPNCARSA